MGGRGGAVLKIDIWGAWGTQVKFWGIGAVGSSEWLKPPLQPRSRGANLRPALRYVGSVIVFLNFKQRCNESLDICGDS